MNQDLSLGRDGTELCRYYEALQLRAYPDSGSPLHKALRRARMDPYKLVKVPQEFAHLSGAPWTIGWGDTGPEVVPGLSITAQEADERFARRMSREFEPAVRRAVQAPLTQRQFDALVSIFYNAGVEAMTSSTLVRLLNLGDFAGAASQFPRWNKSGGVVMKGLQRRREAERLIFLGMAARAAITSAEAVFP